ncbi:hypothetical protein FACS1894132_12290 [Clostridia bacterium]|nr:hypothetical protein FACS1894132_12290 [Clostridia bacterium]
MDYKYTLDDLKSMQSWSFAHKIGVTQTRILEWYLRFDGKVAVNFSGGKDSTVLLSLARSIYPDLPAVFVDTGLEFPEVVNFVKSQENVVIIKPQFCKICTNCKEGCFSKVVKIHGWNFPNKDTAKTIKYARRGTNWAVNAMNGLKNDGTVSEFRERTFKKWSFLLDDKFKISDECCKILKEKPLDKWHK